MIFVDRTIIGAPNCLREPGSIGIRERNEFIEFYSEETNHDKKYKEYRAYKEKEIIEIFNLLFHNKCAYCESNYAKVQPVDVEHYRPKGGVVIDGHLVKPGYYWLASEWDNLLPSCIDCNRMRSHQIDEDEENHMLGKANLFPISNESSRAKKVGNECYEKRLLLNPCIDKPEDHLNFLEDGTILARSFMGLVSIETYGLHRKYLADAREEHAKSIKKAIDDVKFDLAHIDDLINLPGAVHLVERYLDRLRLHLIALKRFLDDKQEYLGLARQIIIPFIETYRSKLNLLIAANV